MKKLIVFLGVLVCLAFAGCGDDGGDDGGQVDASTVDGSGTLPLYEVCTDSSECESNLCFMYGNGERRCTKTCDTPADCPDPSPGCSGMGVCQRPGG